ncbi:serine hydrolase domain-containing protein [Plantactinospora mayteni]|uniref:Serine hydrolase n=1 Tax=Plantactinospora mayteni TaxID=566021 RepID=A0ABQ4F2N2_9ACTN|nr:serine hydrolase domain-containing protein [Plantactinospora mayteni]GIH01181.1 serine hydrolase [Plantactinospora mayteni]
MTRPTSRRTVLGALGAASLAGTALVAAPGTAHAAPPKDLRPGGAYDRLVAGRAAQDMFSGTVLIAHHGRPVLVCAHGMANKDQSIPNRPDTVFWLASITKTFTALAIAQLVQQGKLAFHDTLGAHLAGFPTEQASTVTVHQLLTHTSGVGRPAIGGGTPPGLDWNGFDEVMDGTLALIRQTPLQFTPGTRYAYSNDGFFVLGAIVAKVTGQSYFDYIRQHVFSPAGMTRTDFFSRAQVLANNAIARPYWTQRDGTRADFITSPYAPYTTGPAGGAYSTVTDLLAFARALTAGKLLDPAFVDVITSGKHALPPSQPPSQVEFYGYGYLNTILNNRRIVGHSGSGPGAANRLDIYPDLNWVSIVLSNYDTTINPIIELERNLVTR